MKLDTTQILLIAMMVLILVGLFGKFLGWDNDGEKITVETKSNIIKEVDTVFVMIEKVTIKEPTVTYITKEVLVPYFPPSDSIGVVRSDNTPDSVKIILPINQYIDTLDVDGATLAYDHTVAGYLESSKYRISYPKETITITDSVFTTITKTKNRIFDFFLVGGYQVTPYPEYEIGIDFLTKNWKIGIRGGFDPTLNPIVTAVKDVEPTIKIESGIRLFGY